MMNGTTMDFIGTDEPLLMIMYGVMLFGPGIVRLAVIIYLFRIIHRRFRHPR
jgi:hypothetical protein